jgi:hypothetical protein
LSYQLTTYRIALALVALNSATLADTWHGAEDGLPLPIVRCSVINNEAVSIGGGLRGIAGLPPVVFVDSTVCDNGPDEFDSP